MRDKDCSHGMGFSKAPFVQTLVKIPLVCASGQVGLVKITGKFFSGANWRIAFAIVY